MVRGLKLNNLETLILLDCQELEELPRDIKKMVILIFFITTKQMHLPANGIEYMCSLWNLTLVKCPRLESFSEGFRCLTTLRSFGFANCKSLICSPQGLKHLTALRYLGIRNCEKLSFMEGSDYPMRLRTLYISKLPQLVTLP